MVNMQLYLKILRLVVEQLDDMHEFENDAIRKANLIKEGKRKAYSEEEFLELLEKEGL